MLQTEGKHIFPELKDPIRGGWFDVSQYLANNWSDIHCEDGPAVLLGNGKGIYAWHGTIVPAWIILHPELITPEVILKERNLERRRVLIERYGEGNFLANIGGTLEQEDEYGKLWLIHFDRIPQKYLNDGNIVELFGGRLKLKFVQVHDASTPREYFLQVPSTIKTAHQGIAWTFRLREVEYNPIKQT